MCLFDEVWNINFYFIWWLLKTVSERKSKMWRHSPNANPSHHPCCSAQMKYRFNPTVDQPASLLNKQKTDKWSFCCPPSLLLKLLLYFLLFFVINFIQKLVLFGILSQITSTLKNQNLYFTLCPSTENVLLRYEMNDSFFFFLL